MQIRWMAISLIALLPLAGCKRQPVPPSVSRTLPTAAPTAEEISAASQEALAKDLDPFPPLGDGTSIKTPDGESWTRFSNGVMIQELRIGIEGMPPQLGQTVTVAYVGTFPGTNKEFDRSKPDEPLSFSLGSKSLIKGFSIAVSTMHVGGKRRVYLPADLAYGERGAPQRDISPGQPLIFQLELLSVKGAPVKLPVEKAEPLGPPVSGPASAPASEPAATTSAPAPAGPH